ncbi:TPA: hypothetical protein UM684_002408 [Stenotrophomonas maltophilia]|uniref:hypothetical protein n=1 Tax=Stenotrophomonas maltophilia TaxID=40324 RepID=UPI0014644F90|nr:hypothetical protein [Stenotrophomonas maltophilia]MBH1380587.1 hypothetical protein [Stenotrophomonas maltophilia]MBH1396849.1 hypothetical protein [Stenotrophomonas maltophilia]MBH1468396.1 hypothetical protein [Stenotrophomonas maltophilia]MBH1472937.1 hypothetical protein [Stenotrophomonas maltophilia]QJP19297.1 hypothetical protein HKK60_07010 [Stenotrophomonas maltophilia]
MSGDSNTEVIGGKFHRRGFLQLVSDAVTFHCLSSAEARALPGCRFAKQSILLSALAVESAANCVVADAPLSKTKRKDLLGMHTFAKFKDALAPRGKFFDRERDEAKRVAALIQVRNDLAHPKVFKDSVDIQFKRSNEKWIAEVEMALADSGLLGIRHKPMGWTSKESHTVLEALNDFFAYLFDSVLRYSDGDLAKMFSSYVESDLGHVMFVVEELPDFDEAERCGVNLTAFRRFARVGEGEF